MERKINRRNAMIGLASAVGGLTLSGSLANANEEGERPNIVFILTDDQHFRALGAAGNSEIHTPHIDRLAREGTYFTQCHASNPICTPSRAALLTGQFGFVNGVVFFGQPIRDSSPTWPALLQNAGYTNAYTGKWHNNGRPSDYGFEVMRHTFLGGMHHFNDIPVVDGPDDSRRVIERNPTEVFTEAAVDFLMDAPQQPFSLFVSYTAPHDPRMAPPEYEALYPPESVSLPPNFMPEPRFDPLTLGIRDEELLPRPLDKHAVKTEIGRYYAMMTHLDHQVGLILEALDKQGLSENTYVVFASDNGLALGSHGLLGKQTMYEEGVVVPLIVRGPGVRRGARVDALTDLMDLAPTFLELGGVTVPSDMHGSSLKPLWEGRADSLRDSVFCHYEDLFRMVKTERWKLIHHLRTGREELFDLRNDPHELNDLIDDSSHAATAERLRARLAQWREETQDTGTREPAEMGG